MFVGAVVREAKQPKPNPDNTKTLTTAKASIDISVICKEF